MVVERVGLRVEANLQGVAVVGVESEIGQKEVGQQVFVVVDVMVLSLKVAGKRLF